MYVFKNRFFLLFTLDEEHILKKSDHNVRTSAIRLGHLI